MHMQEISSMASKDQRTLDADVKENKWEKYNRGLDLFIESVQKPDSALRGCAYNQNCYNELMDIINQLNSISKKNKERLCHGTALEWLGLDKKLFI